jgi:hypothetical protein
MAATLLAGCSGGSSSVTPGASTPNSAPQSFIHVALDTGALETALKSRRGAEFVGASVNDIHYAFSGGTAPFGDIPLSSCASSANGGSGITYTCTIAALPGVYGLTLTLKNGATVLGSGTYTNAMSVPVNTFTVTAGSTLPIAIPITPVLAGPAISIENGQATDFFMEGHVQSIALAANELDPVGNIISTYYGPVPNWLTLTLSANGGNAGVTFVGGNTTILAPPSQPSGNTTVIQYDGVSANVASLSLGITDGVNSASTITVPYVSMSTPSNTMTVTAGSANTTVTETISSGTVPDADFVGSTTCLASNVTITSGGLPLALNPITVSGTTGVGHYTITYVGGTGSCTLNVASQADSHLAEAITINY